MNSEAEAEDADEEEEDEIDPYESKLKRALATIKRLVDDDPLETLMVIIDALGLKWRDVAPWAQQQAKWEAEGDEPIEVQAEQLAPIVGNDDMVEAETTLDAAEHGAGRDDTVGQQEPCHTADETPEPEKSSVASETDEIAATTPAIPDALTSTEVVKEPQPSENPSAQGNGQTSDVPPASENAEFTLPELVVNALAKGPLRLVEIVSAVEKMGYKCQSESLYRTVHDTVKRLKFNREVVWDGDMMRYVLTTPEEREWLKQQAEQKERDRQELAAGYQSWKDGEAKKRQDAFGSLATVADMLMTAFTSVASLSDDGRIAAESMYKAADNLGIMLELDWDKDFLPEAAAQACSPAEGQELLAKAERLLGETENYFRLNEPTDEEKEALQVDGQKMLNVACAIARTVGIDS